MSLDDPDCCPPFRLLSLSSSRSMGGLERFQLEVARQLSRRGHTVEFVADPGSKLSAAAEDAGITVHEQRFHRYLAPIAILKLARLMKARKADVLHYRLSRNIWTVAPAARLAGLKGRIVHTLGMNPGGRLNNPLHRWLRRTLGAFVAPTPGTATRAAQVWGMNRDEVTVIPNFAAPDLYQEEGLEAEASEIRRLWEIPPDSLVVGTLSRLEPEKGIDTLVETALLLCAERPRKDVFFIVGGPVSTGFEGWLNGLKSSVQDAGMRDRILFPGFQDRIPAFMNVLDLFVLPSHRETFGMVVVEAMLARLPVIAAHGPGPDFILDNGRAGVLVKPGSPDLLARTISELLEDSERREELAERGLARARERFSDSAVLPVYEALFDKLRNR